MFFINRYILSILKCLLILVFAFGSDVLQTQTYENDKFATPGEYLSFAKKQLVENKFEDVLLILRRLRLRYPESEHIAESLVIAAKAAAALDQTYQERFLLIKALSASQKIENENIVSTPVIINLQLDILIRLAVIFENEKDYVNSYSYFKEAIDKSLVYPTLISTKELNRLLLSAANTAYLSGTVNNEICRNYLYSLKIDNFSDLELQTLKRLANRLKWEYLSANDLGFRELNVSALSLDQNDLWVGSWTGGLSRYSITTKTRKVFSSSQNNLSPTSIRKFLRFDRYMWVGTDQGLSVYSRASSRWRRELITGLNPPFNKISSI